MADAPALGAGAAKAACRFDPDLAYQLLRYANLDGHPARRPDLDGRDDPDLADEEAQQRFRVRPRLLLQFADCPLRSDRTDVARSSRTRYCHEEVTVHPRLTLTVLVIAI